MSKKITAKGVDFDIKSGADSAKVMFDKILANKNFADKTANLTARGVRIEYDSCGKVHVELLLSSDTNDIKTLAKKMGVEEDLGGGEHWTPKAVVAPTVVYVQAASTADASAKEAAGQGLGQEEN